MTDIPESLLRVVMSEHNVSEAELGALVLALTGQTAESIATTLKISAPAVRKRLGSVYQKFGIAGGTPGKLEVLRSLLHQRCQLLAAAGAQSRRDFGEAPDVPVFFGRGLELDTLEQWIVKERCRLVAILGMGGIGKTTLSVKLVQKIQDQFEYVIWRSLRNAPSIKDIFADLIKFLSDNNETKTDLEDTEVGISQLIACLRKHRCLLVLDNAESILLKGDQAGHYRKGYEGYDELFRQIGEVPHQSCLVLTSRESFKEISPLEGDNLKVQTLQLGGLDNVEAKRIFTGKGDFSGTEDDWGNLINHYAGNPLALKIVATTIQEVFGGNISEFLRQGTAVFVGNLRNILDQQYERLSDLEKDILYWLAINIKPTSLSELQEDIISIISNLELIEALESLRRRSLIDNEKGSAKFTLQPVVMEYMINHFIKQICDEILSEITSERISLFKSHVLFKAQTEGKIRNTQVRFILEPIADTLVNTFGNKSRIKEHLLQILSVLQEETPLTIGYAGGNVINLLCHLEIDLSRCDFSNLKIWQAYLVGVNLHHVNFADSDLSRSVFTGILNSILSVAFNPVKGDILAMGDADGRVSLWQVTYGKQLFSWKAHANWIRCIAFSPDGKILATSSDDHSVKLWDVESQKCLKTLEEHTNWVRSVAFSPQGHILASGSSDETVKLWDVRTHQSLRVLKGHDYFVQSVAFSPDGQIVASGSADQTIRIWNVNTGECLNILKGHTKLVKCVVFASPYGEAAPTQRCANKPSDVTGKTPVLLASGSADQTIRIWDVNTGKCLTILEGHTKLVQCIAFSPNGRTLASGSADQTIRIWDVNTGKCLNIFPGHINSVRSVAFSLDGKTLASSGYDKTVRFWDMDTRNCIQILQGYSNWIHDIALSPDGKTLASSSDDKAIRFWDVNTGQCIQTLEGQASRIWSIAFSPDGQILASGGDDQAICLWDVRLGKPLKTLPNTDRVRSLTFSSDGQTLASGSVDRRIRLWNVRTGQCFETLEAHNNWVQSVTFSPDGETLASGSDDKTIGLWNVHTGRCIHTLTGHTMRISSVAFSSDSQTLASGSNDKTVRLWDVRTGQCLKTFYSQDEVLSVALSPQGQILASASINQTIEIWDVTTAQRLLTLTGHNNGVLSVVFSPDGQNLYSGSQDGSVKHWDVKTGECLNTLVATRPYERMNIKGVIGLTESQKETLKELGAIEN
ncbi:MAG: PD40 domain-containing protein [Iphinoe sp. HA4291-MV1]|jgi:WD40 repeat protein/DNA-binding CsgD family transcriptional regulator|nr:PD40 domain-containing protein [Iphinoe sp. HA4291-MV1]